MPTLRFASRCAMGLVLLTQGALAERPSTNGTDEWVSVRSKFDPAFQRFVPADSALDKSGRLRQELFAELPREIMNDTLASGGEDCVNLGDSSEQMAVGKDRSSFRKALHASEVVLSATVSSITLGFEDGIPGQLLELEVDRVLNGTTPGSHLGYFIPIAEFKLGGIAICKSDSRYPSPPAVGELVFLLLPRQQDLEDTYVDSQNAFQGTQLVVVPAEGHARGGRALSGSIPTDLSRANAAEYVARLLAEQAK